MNLKDAVHSFLYNYIVFCLHGRTVKFLLPIVVFSMVTGIAKHSTQPFLISIGIGFRRAKIQAEAGN